MAHNPNRKIAEARASLVETTSAGVARWTGKVRLLPDQLDLPLRWRKPKRIFVANQSDLFHEDVPDDFLDRAFSVMARAKQHTFQVLTKRADRMRRYVGGCERGADDVGGRFPWSNIWLGVSCEDQTTADERIPHLLATPAAVRFVSAEPLLGPINLRRGIYRIPVGVGIGARGPWLQDIDWVIIGGESGPKARLCDLAWIRSLVEQCRAAGTACFVKQIGARPLTHVHDSRNRPGRSVLDRKGGDPSEWPADLRVREMPRRRA